MTIKIFKICLFDGKRINELYEQNQQKAAKIRELHTAVRAQDRQMKGWGKVFEQLLEQIEELKTKYRVMTEERDEWIRRYQKSEEARKSLGEKLEKAMGAQELLTPKPQAEGNAVPSGSGSAQKEGGAEA